MHQFGFSRSLLLLLRVISCHGFLRRGYSLAGLMLTGLAGFLDFHPEDFVGVEVHQHFHVFFGDGLCIGMLSLQGMKRYFPHAPVPDAVQAQSP